MSERQTYDDAKKLMDTIPVLREDALAAIEDGDLSKALSSIDALFALFDRMAGKQKPARPGRKTVVERYAPEDIEAGRRMIADGALLIEKTATKNGMLHAAVTVPTSFSNMCEKLLEKREDAVLDETFAEKLWTETIADIGRTGAAAAEHSSALAAAIAVRTIDEAIGSKDFLNRIREEAERGEDVFRKSAGAAATDAAGRIAKACLPVYLEDEIASCAALWGHAAVLCGRLSAAGLIDEKETAAKCRDIYSLTETFAGRCLEDYMDEAASSCVLEASGVYTDIMRAYRKENPGKPAPEILSEIRGELKARARRVAGAAEKAGAESTLTMCEAVLSEIEDETVRERQV